MKRLLSLVLVVLLLVSCSQAFAEGDYAEHYTFSIVHVDRSHDIGSDAMYQYFCEPLNIDIEPIALAYGAISETNNIMVTSGTMYDAMMLVENYGMIADYGAQDLIKPLPEGWEEKYPNIKKAFDMTNTQDFFSYDGKVYGVPRTLGMWYSGGEASMNVVGLYYRADWAKELGFDFGDAVTESEFVAYLKACVESDKAGNGQTIGLGSGGAPGFFVQRHTLNTALNAFNCVDGKYVWGPQVEGTIEGIKAAKQYYNDGILDPDFFTLDDFAGRNMLSSGACAATTGTITPSAYQMICDNAEAAGMENPTEKIRQLVVTDDNGALHHTAQSNLLWATIFNPELTDDEFDRILTLYDNLYSKEGNEVRMFGIKGEDWDIDENGQYVIMLDSEKYASIGDKYPSYWLFIDQSIQNTDITPLTIPAQYTESYDAYRAVEAELAASTGYTAVDITVETLNTEAYANYSVDINSEISRIVCDKTISIDDVEKEWNAFIEANAAIWQPVVDDLNATLG